MVQRYNTLKKRIRILSWVGSLLIVGSTIAIAILFGLRSAGNFVFACSTVIALGFCVGYYFSAKWNSTAPGRAIMWIMGSFATVGIVVSLSLFFGTGWTGRDHLRLAAYTVVALSLWNISLVLARYQAEVRLALKIDLTK